MIRQKTKNVGLPVRNMPESTSNATNQSTSFIVTLEQDPENPEGLIMPIPDELFDLLGWTVDDILEWDVQDDRIVLKRVEQ